MSNDKLREAVAKLVRIMVTRRHSDLCQQGGDCEVCEAMCDINAALADSADVPSFLYPCSHCGYTSICSAHQKPDPTCKTCFADAPSSTEMVKRIDEIAYRIGRIAASAKLTPTTRRQLKVYSAKLAALASTNSGEVVNELVVGINKETVARLMSLVLHWAEGKEPEEIYMSAQLHADVRAALCYGPEGGEMSACPPCEICQHHHFPMDPCW